MYISKDTRTKFIWTIIGAVLSAVLGWAPIALKFYASGYAEGDRDARSRLVEWEIKSIRESEIKEKADYLCGKDLESERRKCELLQANKNSELASFIKIVERMKLNNEVSIITKNLESMRSEALQLATKAKNIGDGVYEEKTKREQEQLLLLNQAVTSLSPYERIGSKYMPEIANAFNSDLSRLISQAEALSRSDESTERDFERWNITLRAWYRSLSTKIDIATGAMKDISQLHVAN